jgi:hypothetical protein
MRKCVSNATAPFQAYLNLCQDGETESMFFKIILKKKDNMILQSATVVHTM